MGAYLSRPITTKDSSDKVGKNVAFGASSMQGWRISQEDAHNCCIEFDENVSLFAVYDGHGGYEVATYCALYLPDYIKQTEAYKQGDVKKALIDAFLGFDATLTKPDVVNVLKELAGTSMSDKKEDDFAASDEEENVSNLCKEATMPLEEVMAKYQSEVSNANVQSPKNENYSKAACSASLYAGCKEREKACSSSSSGAGCSSSSSAWNTNEADVSSSSQPCGSTTSSTTERKDSDCTGNNEAEQVLDSTTSNGNAHASPPVESTADVEPVKSIDMPDSSEDVNDKVSSPGKPTSIESTANEVEVNGAESKRIGDADSSKSGGDNVSSSSCTPIENGDVGQQKRGGIGERRRIKPVFLGLLKKDNEDSEEDEDDDENDETFDVVPESFSDEDDTEDIDEDESDEEDEDDEDEEADGDTEDHDSDDFMISRDKPGFDSGCTAVVAILKENELYVANAGDSRCVLCRDGQALELSLDHKPEDEPEMERIVKAGGKVTADGRVNGGLNLSRALGDHAYKQNIVLPAQEQMISALPDVRHITIDPKRDEFMILACDGIWNFMSSHDVVEFIRARLGQNYDNLSKICEELFDHCLAPDNHGDGTGCDNMTAVIVRFNPPSEIVRNSTVSQVCAGKRSLSPPVLAKDSNDSVTQQETVNSCKRPKTEETM